MGWRKKSSATTGRDQNRVRPLGSEACMAANPQMATDRRRLVKATGKSHETAADKARMGRVQRTWYSKEVQNIKAEEGAGA
jgi:hypothetical protein